TDLAGKERCLVGYDKLHSVENAELFCLLRRQHRVVAPVDVKQYVGAGVGDVEKIRGIIRRTERRDLIGHGRPTGFRKIILHRFCYSMPVGIVGREICSLLALAKGLDDDWADRGRRGLAIEALSKAVAHAVLTCSVV